MSWTEADSDALFRHPPDERAGDDASAVFDGSRETMRRMRFPFEANAAETGEQSHGGPAETPGS